MLPIQLGTSSVSDNSDAKADGSDRGIYKAFYNTHIEDCWIPFYCNSTNITHSRMEIHRSGYAWRYVRASMTLAGLLPPLSDNGDCRSSLGIIADVKCWSTADTWTTRPSRLYVQVASKT